MNADLKLRYTVDGERKTLALAAPDGSWRLLATILIGATRQGPEAEEAWQGLLGDAIEAAAEAAEGS